MHQTAKNNGWSAPALLSNSPAGVSFAAAPSMVLDSAGRLHLLALSTDHAVWHSWLADVASNAWSWDSLGVPLGYAANAEVPVPALATNRGGGLEFVVAGSDRLWHRWQLDDRPSGNWGAWYEHGMPDAISQTFYRWPALAPGADGLLELFVVANYLDESTGSDDFGYRLWNKKQIDSVTVNSRVGAPFTSPAHVGGWTAWADLGSDVGPAATVVQAADGRIELKIPTTSGAQILQAWQDNTGAWSALTPHSTPPQVLFGGFATSAVGAAASADGRLEVMAIGATGDVVWHTWQTTPNGDWSDLTSPSGWFAHDAPPARHGKIVGTPVLIPSADGRLEAFVSDAQGANLWHKWQHAINGAWTDQWIAHPAPPAVTLRPLDRGF